MTRLNILVLQRVPWHYIGYDAVIDHTHHDVTYIGTAPSLATIRADLRCTRIERPGTGDVVEEVLRLAPAGMDRLVVMSQYEVVQAARLRTALGLPGRTPADVELVDDKLAMKRAVFAAGLRAPRFASAQAAASGETALPWSSRTIIKPIAETASRGVSVFDTAASAVEHLQTLSATQLARFEIEEFVTGPILHFDGLMLGGDLVFALANRYGGTPHGYALGNPMSTTELDDDGGRCAQIAPFLRAVGLTSGPFHLEMFDTAEGLVFLEVAARGGGGAICERVRLATGVDLVRADLALQVDGDSPLATHPARALLEPRRAAGVFGEFLFPGHLIETRYCRVVGAEPYRTHPSVIRWSEHPANEPLNSDISYNNFDIPLSGTVTGATTSEVEQLLAAILADVRIEPMEAAAV